MASQHDVEVVDWIAILVEILALFDFLIGQTLRQSSVVRLFQQLQVLEWQLALQQVCQLLAFQIRPFVGPFIDDPFVSMLHQNIREC